MNVLETLEKLAESGSPRPWRHSVAGWVFEGAGDSSAPVAIAHEVNGADVRDENADLIVAAVNALPDLLAVAKAAMDLPWELNGNEISGDEVLPSERAIVAALEPLLREAQP